MDSAQRSYALSLLAVFYWELRIRLTGHDSRAPYESVIEDDPGWPNVKSSLALESRLSARSAAYRSCCFFRAAIPR